MATVDSITTGKKHKPAFVDATGMRFGRLLVISRAPNRGEAVCWNCICDCGTEKVIRSNAIRFGATVSCGCFAKEATGKRAYKHGLAYTKQYMANYHKQRKLNDPLHNLTVRIRKLIRQALKVRKIEKYATSTSILGCSFSEFRDHIEKQFTKGMSWDRISEIHLDHIIPLKSGRTEEDVIRLCHYTNLRPLWAKDNLSKGAKQLYLC